MHRDWKHDVSETWLLARRPYLTASEIKNLLADYKRIKAGKIDLMQAQQFAKVYGAKQQREIDTSSFGAMARGHVMEPFAVEDYNAWRGSHFQWWDDCVIGNGDLGFSPDALNIQQLPGVRLIVDGDELKYKGGSAPGPTRLLEIKSYEAGAHYQRKIAVAEHMPIDERWQVACGMAVCPTIEAGAVCFYAPQCEDMFDVKYTRGDLEEEIDVISEIAKMWHTFSDNADMTGGATPLRSEEEIYNQYLIDSMTN